MKLISTTKFITTISGNITDQTFSLFRPLTQANEGYFYDIIAIDENEVEKLSFPVASLSNALVAAPVDFEPIIDYSEFNPSQKTIFFRPIPPQNYSSLGIIVADSIDNIPKNILCVNSSFVESAEEYTTIKIFHPFGPYIELNRTTYLEANIQDIPPLLKNMESLENEDFSRNLNEICSNIEFSVTKEEKLPVLEYVANKDTDMNIIKSENENDNMTEIKVSQILNGIGIQLPNFYELEMDESEYFEKTNEFELVGITSLSRPDKARSGNEDYLYVFMPIADLNYEPISLVISEERDISIEVFTISERVLMKTSSFQSIGKVYSKDTASFISNYWSIMHSSESENEKERKIVELGDCELDTTELIMPKGGQGIIQLRNPEDEYYIIEPSVLAYLNSNLSVSQKMFVKAIKVEEDSELVDEVVINDKIISVLEQKLGKSYYSNVLECYAVDQKKDFEFNYEFPKIEGKFETQEYNIETQKELQLKEFSLPEYLPIELQVICKSSEYENQTLAEPESYEIIHEEGGSLFIKLIPPKGYCCLSDVIWPKEKSFNKSYFSCVNLSFCQEIKCKQFLELNENYFMVEAVWPYGTEENELSEYRPIHYMHRQLSFENEYIYILKDTIIQGLAMQEELELKFTKDNIALEKESLEVSLLYKHTLEVKTVDICLFDRLFLLNSIDSNYYSFGSTVDVFNTGIKRANNPTLKDEEAEMLGKQLNEFDENEENSLLLTSKFEAEESPSAMFSKPRELELHSAFKCHDVTYYVFKIIPFENYVSLSDLITTEQNPDKNEYVTIQKSFVTYVNITNPLFILSGYYETNGSWIYEHQNQLFSFDFPEENIRLPVLSEGLESIIEEPPKHQAIYPYNQNLICTDVTQYYSLFVSFAHNNHVSMSELKIYDFGMSQFDAETVEEPIMSRAAMISAGNMRVFTSEQKIEKELVEAAMKPEEKGLEEFTDQTIRRKAELVRSVYYLLEQLNLCEDFNYFGKKPELCFKVGMGYIAITDKIPLSPDGEYFGEETVCEALFEKMCAKCCGGYTQLYQLAERDIVERILQLFNFNFEQVGCWVFDLYICNGQLQYSFDEKAERLEVYE